MKSATNIRNHDVVVDPITGEVYPQVGNRIGDSIGNIFDHLGGE